jgi:predicted phage tail protein
MRPQENAGVARPLVLGLLLAGLVGACSQESTAPEDLTTLLDQTCAGSLCHLEYDGAPAEGLDLAPEVMCAHLVDVPSAQAAGELLVVSGDISASYLACKIDPDCPRVAEGSALMPLAADPLTIEQRAIITEWIAAGVPGCPAPDAEPPQFAGASAATGLSSAIRLDWTAASDDTSAAADITYLIHEATTAGGQDFAMPGYTTAPGATSFTVTGLPVSATRYYVVRARDQAGNIDANTVEVSATTLETGDETAPTFAGLETASPVGSTAVQLSWTPATDDVSPPEAIRYRVYVATTSGAQDFGSPAAESAAGATELLVSGLGSDSTYYFVVRAVDGSGNEDANTVERSAATATGVSFSADVLPI